jgi:hypothetical protein
MACDHPAPDETITVQPDDRPAGEYIVLMGRDVAQGPIPMDKIVEAGELSHQTTGMVARAYRSGNHSCAKCGDWWSETTVRPARPGDNVADDLLSA